MSCIPGSSNSKNDIDRWTTNVKIMLDSPRGRRKFNQFLSTRHLEEGEVTLQFWENCNRILMETSHNHHLLNKDDSAKIHHSRFLHEVTSLLEFAEEYVNFDMHRLREFRQVVEKQNIPEILKIISSAQTAAALLMKTEYDLFKKVLLKDYTSSQVKNMKK